jgi:transcriptional regulator with XRE-family HTH domain
MSDDSGADGAELQPVGEMVDMFDGTSSPYRDPRGRKKPRISNESRDDVATWRAAGMTQQQIADALGCSVPTLVEYFSFELNEGKSVKRAEAIKRLYQLGVIEGNVTALKAYIAMTEKDVSPRDIIRPKAEPKLGKKEQALVDAKSKPSAGGWAAVVRH